MSDVALAGIIGACGALIGVLISQLLEVFRQNRGFAIRQKEKIIDKRIEAHESILDLCESMIVVTMPEGVINYDLPEDTEKPIRGIAILNTEDIFDKWWAEIFYNCYRKHVWLSPKVLKELNLFQDYLVNLKIILSQLNADEIKRLSVIVRPDFITMSVNLRRDTVSYLSKDAISFKLRDLNGWHKYKRPHTEKRLNDTQLLKEYTKYLEMSQQE